MALTAGYDTRLLLACSRNLRQDIRFVTVAAPDAELDLLRARELADRFGLNHRTLPYVEADAAGMRHWQRSVSHGITGSNIRMHPSMRPLDGTCFIGGLGGEVGRGFLWLGSDEHTELDADNIISRLKLPLDPKLREAVDAWLEPLKHLDSLLVLDLAYLELRMSSWAFAQAYSQPRLTEINPLISRRVYKAMWSLDPSARRDNGMIFRAIRATWPEVLELPINRYGDWRDRYQQVRTAVADPARALRKLRQLASVRAISRPSQGRHTA